MIKIAPSILAADVLNLERDVRKVVDAGCDWLHIDVMDAHFVPNLAYTPAVVRRLKETFPIPLDVHLMMDEPERFLDAFLDAGADILTIHAEISGDKGEMLDKIRYHGTLAGLAIRPGTPVEEIAEFLPRADLILTMTVEPGFGGQSLNRSVPEKIRILREMGYRGEIEADGGITAQNLGWLADNGLSVAVMGTAVFRAEDAAEAIRSLKTLGQGENA